MVQEEDPGVLRAHIQAVGDKAAGYMWSHRISACYLKLDEYNGLVQKLATGTPIAPIKQAEIQQLQADLTALVANNGTPEDQAEFQRAIALAGEELKIFKRLDASAIDAKSVLGAEFSDVLSSLRIRDLSPRHAFRTATTKLEHKDENELVNYLIRKVSDEGVTQERHIVREVKDPQGKVLDYVSVARLLYTEREDAFGNRSADIATVILKNEPFVVEACQQIKAVFDREVAGASSSRFTTAIKHLTKALRSIPLAGRGGVYYCAVSKAPVVTLTRELVRWVDLRYRTSSGDGCYFLALPLLGGEEVREEVAQAANTHLQLKLSEAIAGIQAIRKAREALDGEEDTDEKAEKMQKLNNEELRLRNEVIEVQASVQTCLEELTLQQGALQQGSKVLLKEYATLLGV